MTTSITSEKELATKLAIKRNGFNGKVYGGVNEPLHIFVGSEKIEVSETFAATFEKAYEVSMTDEAFDALFEGDEAGFQFILNSL